MIINDQITVLGDVHLGRTFTTGVPLHRRGEREQMVWSQFVEELENCHTPIHVQTGDLFNQFAVPERLVLDTANAYRSAAEVNPETTYIVYRGNHDASRDTGKASSFDVFAELLNDVDNVIVLREVYVYEDDKISIGFIPWHPFRSAEALANELVDMCNTKLETLQLDYVFGHFDVESFGGEGFNIVPTSILYNLTKTVLTGHIHKPTTFTRDDVEVIVVGSMQPYAHGEQINDDLYVTKPLVDALDPSNDFEHKNLRVLLRPGEALPDVDCLALTSKPFLEKNEDDDVESDDLEVKFEEFNMHNLFVGCLKAQGVGPLVADLVMEKFAELKNVQ